MSIAGRTGQGASITEGWRTLDLFTNRFNLIRIFTSYLNEYPSQERILFLYGEGGNGKSLLLKFFEEYCCKYIDARNWEWIKSKPEDEFIELIKNVSGAEDVPSALIDFNPNLGGDDSIKYPFSALLTLRRALVHPGLQFPQFDFACAWYLSSGGKLTDQQRQYLLLGEGTKLIAKLIDAISGTLYGAVATAVLNIYNQDLSHRFNLFTRRRNLNAESFKGIQRLSPETTLITHLPCLFAEDLGTSMLLEGAPKKVVLFFDAHEAFWGIERMSEELFFRRDEWLRSLLAQLELSRGIIVVVAGQQRPRWSEASKPGTVIADEFIDLQHVGPLSEEHALQYLERAEIEDSAMRECLVAYAQVEPGQVHPLYLGLCADVVRAAQEKGETLTPEGFQSAKDTADKGTELMRRLLLYVDDDIAYPVRALSACRAFDKDLYFKLGDALKLGVTEQSFDYLIRFSFVWRVERRGKGWYRIHNTLRRIFDEKGDEITRRANEYLYDYYRLRGDSIALAESVYHSNRLNRENSIDGWLLVFQSGMEMGRYELCRLLLEVRSELKINRGVDTGRLLDQEGDYFERIAKYEDAEQSYVAAITAFDEALLEHPKSIAIHDLKGNTLHSLGEIQAKLSRHAKAYKSYRKALSIFNKILKYVPDHSSKTQKGMTLVSLGMLLALRSKTNRAIKKYEEAIRIFEEDVRRWPSHADSHSHIGVAYISVGNIQFELSQYDEAIESFNKAISAYDEAIKQIPILFRFYHNKGTALIDLGDVEARLKHYDESEKSYVNAIACFDEALRFAPETRAALDSKGVALRHLGDVQMDRSHDGKAMESYQQAINSFDEALRLTPEDIAAKFNKATALENLGLLKSKAGDHEEWVSLYHRAIAIFDELIEKAPDFIHAYNNKGIALLRFGQLHIVRGEYIDAEEITRTAITTLDEAIQRSPSYVFARNNKGRALRNLAVCHYFLGDYEAAAKASEMSVAEFSWSTDIAPRDERIHMEKTSIGSFLTMFDENFPSSHKPSLQTDLTANKTRFDRFIEAVGGSSTDLDFKASNNDERDFDALLQLLSTTETDKNIDHLLKAFAKQCEAAISINPKNHLVLCHWGSLLHHWAKMKEGEEADHLFALACEKYESALQDPSMHWVLNDWGVVLTDWAKTKTGFEANQLFTLACKKHEAALKVKPTKHESYLNWGGALYAWACNKSGEDAGLLLDEACAKYEAGLQIKPDDFMLMHNWGLALKHRAFSLSGDDADRLFALACEKFEAALRIKPDEENSLDNLQRTLSRWGDVIRARNGMKDPIDLKQLYGSIYKHFEIALRINPNQEEIFFFWGNALLGQAGITVGHEAEQLLLLANDKFQTAVSLKPDISPAYVTWGTSLIELAKIKSEESESEADSLLEAACGKLEKAAELQPDMWESIINWGAALAERAKRQSGDEANRLWSAAIEKYESVVNKSPDEYKALALHGWGTVLTHQATQTWRANTTKDKLSDPETTDLLKAAFSKFEAAHRINPNDVENLVSWGMGLTFQAVTIPWETLGQEASSLYAQAFERFNSALRINPKDVTIRKHQVDCLSGWASALLEWAKTEKEKKATKLLFLACEKLEKAHAIDPKNARVLRDWGISLYEVAEVRKGKKYIERLNLASRKLEESISLVNDDPQALLYWSRAQRAIAMTQMSAEERQFLELMLESIRKSGYEV
jgi:tetratricopeptide (TPR) repeat protein